MLVVCMAVWGAENWNEDLHKLLKKWIELMIDNLQGLAWDSHFEHDFL